MQLVIADASRNAHGEHAVGATVEWFTPPELLAAIGLTYDVDPASPLRGPVPWIPATRFYSPSDNGLIQPWAGRVWLNPPYGNMAVPFLHRLAEHGHGIALVFARTEVDWWQASAPRATAVCFLRDRLYFIREDGFRGRAAMGSALLAFGADCADAIERADLGWLVRP